jgi:hypothetical protein
LLLRRGALLQKVRSRNIIEPLTLTLHAQPLDWKR